jgi:hypothetical protein
MKPHTNTKLGMTSFLATLALCLTLGGCADGKDDSSEHATTDETGDETGDGIGNPVGEPVDINHASASQTVQDNILMHMNGLNDAIAFLEDSTAVNNLVDLLFSDDDEDEDGEEAASGDDEPIDLDMSELRDSLVEMMNDRMMVESTATLADDGLSITYAITAEHFCVEDPEEDESEEDAEDRAEDEADCTERLTETPMAIGVMSYSEGDMNLSLLVGATADNVVAIQLHDDQISARIELPKIKQLVEVFVSPEDFELPSTMEGSMGVEIRRDAADAYTARFAVIEDINVTPDADQEQFSVHMSQTDEPGSIAFDGGLGTIDGLIAIDAMDASIPWQIIVDMFYDDEGYSEWICETNEETGEEDCWEEWIEPEESPEVDEAFAADIPGISAAIAYTASDDAFAMTNLGLGDATTTVKVGDATIISIDVNPDNDRRFDFTFDAPGDRDIGFAFSADFAAQVSLAWSHVEDVIPDLPDFLADDTIGVRFGNSATPQLHIIDIDDETEVQMASGTLTLWADAMAEDAVIEEGECLQSTDCEGDECDEEHDLFGGLHGGACGE